MEIEQLTSEQLSRLERWLARYPDLDGLEALVLEQLEVATDAGRARLDSGRLSRELDVAHALVRRTAAALEGRGLIDVASRCGAGPGLWLALIHESAVPRP